MKVLVIKGERGFGKVKHLMETIKYLQAENDRLRKENSQYDPFHFCSYSGCEAVSMDCWKTCPNSVYNKTKAEAYKECIEKVKEKAEKFNWVSSGVLLRTEYTIGENSLDNLYEELMGEDK